MKKILVINLGWEQEPLLQRLNERDDLELYGIHYDEHYSRIPRYRDVFICDLRDLRKVMAFARKVQPDAVISDQCDYSFFAQALIATQFNLPGPPIAPAYVATNKYLQRKHAQKSGIMNPSFKQVFSPEDIVNFTELSGFPVMVKPVDNRGSFGVHKINTSEEIGPAFVDAVANSNSRDILVEKYIEGRHITVDGYLWNGVPKTLAVATKDKLAQKHAIIDGQITYPGDLSEKDYQNLSRALERLATYFGFSFGFLHGEFILTDSGDIYLTEIANRGGGVLTSEIIVPQVSGVDVVGRYIADCLGENQSGEDAPEPDQSPVVMKFFAFNSPREGVIKRIHGICDALSSPGVLALKMLVAPGDYVTPIQSGADRHGMIIVTAPDKRELEKRLTRAISHIEVQYERC